MQTLREPRAVLYAWDNFEEKRSRLFKLLQALSYRHADDPVFKLASGKMSRDYFDVRQTALNAEGARLIGEIFSSLISYHAKDVVAIGGLSIGADPLVAATIVSEAFNATRGDPPMLQTGFLVRKEMKYHGVKGFIVGGDNLPELASVAICDDVITTGESMLRAMRAARSHKVNGHDRTFVVKIALAVVDREEEHGRENILREVSKVFSIFRKSEFRNGACIPLSNGYRVCN